MTEPALISAGAYASNEELEGLLRAVYVGGGFTDPALADKIFAPDNVRERGTLVTARDPASQALLGMIILVPPEGAARQIARGPEAEVHLLAVAEAARRRGVGRALVTALVKLAVSRKHRELVLSTQANMHAAHVVYSNAGFLRTPERDWSRAEREFLTYHRAADD